MNPNEFFLWNALVVGAMVASIYVLRFRRQSPSRLDLRAEQEPLEMLQATGTDGPSQPIQLNVFFNFNGHSWDAFEALGLPAGSSAADVEAAFSQLISECDETSVEFYQLALQAIRDRE